MTGERQGPPRGSIRALFESGTVVGLTDGQLLERFVIRRGESSEPAFAALVERHGPMVLRVCQGVLGDDHQAMDAFQATFFILARKGGSLWVRDSIGPWLHRVALRAAGRAKRNEARRLARERRAVAMLKPRSMGAADPDRRELAAIVNEEVDRLPERYRAAVVLCDLEGRTREDAARHLGCPVGTVGSRLARGRDRLRERLARRGLASGLLALPSSAEPLPAGLTTATAVAAARFVSNQAASRGLAAMLAMEVLGTMTMTTWWKAALCVLLATASTSGVASLAGKGAATEEGRPNDPPQTARSDAGPTVEVKPGPLALLVDGPGRLETVRNSDVVNKVQAPTTILSLLPEGARVVKGQLVCELDSAVLRDQLVNQRIAVLEAEDAERIAKLADEVAEAALQAYLEGEHPSELAAAVGAIKEAQSALSQAGERINRTRAARERLKAIEGPTTAAGIVAELDLDDRLADAEQTLVHQKQILETAQATLKAQQLAKERTRKQLELELLKSRAASRLKKEAVDMAKATAAALERQIAACKLEAPNEGMLVYAERIKEGAVVRARQKLFSIPDLDGPFQVVARVHESWIDRIRPGQTAQITVDAFRDETFKGTVETVAPLPDPVNMTAGFAKVYTVHVAVARKIPGLRPGMTARAKILVAALDDVLSVPIGAVVRYNDKDHVAVRTSDEAPVVWREVTLGLSTDTDVEVKSGLKAGESLVLEPTPLLSKEQKRKASILQPPSGSTDASEARGKERENPFPPASVQANQNKP